VKSLKIPHPVHPAPPSCLPLETWVPRANARTGKTLSKLHQLHQPQSKSPFGHPGADVGCLCCNRMSPPKDGSRVPAIPGSCPSVTSQLRARVGTGCWGHWVTAGNSSAKWALQPSLLGLREILASNKRFAKYLHAAAAWIPAWRPETLCASGCRTPCCAPPGGPRRRGHFGGACPARVQSQEPLWRWSHPSLSPGLACFSGSLRKLSLDSSDLG